MADDGGCPLDVVSYSTGIDGFFKEGDLDKAYATYHEMLDWRILPDFVTYNSIIAALCKAEAMDKTIEQNPVPWTRRAVEPFPNPEPDHRRFSSTLLFSSLRYRRHQVALRGEPLR
ncbi:hypothetical protein E2562_034929 [Oryza meyeriana var. granulata]|uniref:Pentatricopeptide repeat-containing protein n=1 Tax=Oryza meyeriana var. granulata TaxID=110450 RepID=A0A6G1F1H1_9ORYZ|nr:hypothetical protein E2562_034929 [Oryza meyeriana var. granulata]